MTHLTQIRRGRSPNRTRGDRLTLHLYLKNGSRDTSKEKHQ
ncbi:hypothetical protein [Phormidium pseudopriestleyi]|nr:hypothetical protein [Phormidium pseudopriestleyi]